MSHVAYTRLLHQCQSDGKALWQEIKLCISRVGGILVVDDSTLDKFYARMIEWVTRHRSATAQHNHIGLALRAFLRQEVHHLRTGVSWFEAKTAIIREAVQAYLAQPPYTQTLTA